MASTASSIVTLQPFPATDSDERVRGRRTAAAASNALTDVAAFPIVLDASLNIFAVSDALVSLLRISCERLIGQPCSLICSGLDSNGCPRDDSCPITAGAVESESPAVREVGLRTCSGDELDASGRGFTLADGGAVVMFTVAGRGNDSSTDRAVRVWELGQFAATLPDGQPLKPRRPQTVTLFKLLLCHRGQPLDAGRIARFLWPNAPPRRGLERFRALLHDLRYALEPDLKHARWSRYVERDGNSYLIPADAPIETDADAFKSAIERARRAATAGRQQDAMALVRNALRLYRGELFASDVAVEWFANRRRRLHTVWQDALLLHAALLHRSGDSKGAIDECSRVVDSDLLREDAHRMLMLLLGIEVGRDAGLRHFVEASRAVRQRFKLPLSRETAGVARKLQSDESLPDPSDYLLRLPADGSDGRSALSAPPAP